MARGPIEAARIMEEEMSGHGSCYLCANGEDGVRYYRFVGKYSDAQETAFKAAIKARTGHGARTVRRENSEPANGVEI